MNAKKITQILIPVIIILVVTGIWLIKNAGTAVKDPSVQQGIPQTGDDPNLDLEAEAIDLDTLTAYGLPLIIDFGSDSCIPCQQMAPVLKTINGQMRGKAIIKFVDVWKHTTAADSFPVQVIPTQVILNADGTPYVPSDSMDDSGIQFTLYSSKDTGEHVFTVHQGGLTEKDMLRILADMGVSE